MEKNMVDIDAKYLKKRENLSRLRLSIAEGCLDKLVDTLSLEERDDLIRDINSLDLVQKEKIIEFLTPKKEPVVEPVRELNAFELYKLRRGI